MNKIEAKENRFIAYIRNNWNRISLIIIALLFLMNLFLLRFYLQHSRRAVVKKDDNTEVKMSIRELEIAYNDKFQAYEALKRENSSQKEEIEQLQQSLLADKERIAVMAQGGASSDVLSAEISNLKKASDEQIRKLTLQIAGLQKTNTQLTNVNKTIQDESSLKDSRIQSLTTVRDSIEKLAKDAEERRQQVLKEKEKALSDAATTAREQKIRDAYLSIGNVKINTTNSGGKEKSKAKKVNQIRIFFTPIPDAENLVYKGNQDFYFQLLDPAGVPVELNNSTNLQLKNGKEIWMAVKTTIEYEGEAKEQRAIIGLDKELSPGKYKVLFFHNRRQVDQKDFNLTSGLF